MVAVLDCCREILKETSKEEPEETQAKIFGPVTDQQPPEKQPETKVIEEYQNLILIHAFQVGSNMRPKLLVPALVEKVLKRKTLNGDKSEKLNDSFLSLLLYPN